MDITPTNQGKFAWSKAQSLDEFEREYSFKPVTVRGVFDHEKEMRVDKVFNGEKGQEVITPFYTHLNEKGEECGILVSRGWIPYDFKDLNYHYTSATSGTITGLLYRGDAKTKYAQLNTPSTLDYKRVDPHDFSRVLRMNNKEEASQFMLKIVDLDDSKRQILPNAPNSQELTTWQIPAERHQAYASLWKYLTFVGVFANTALWLYF